MLTRAIFRGFKALADVTVDLEPLTVLVGPNASGKSTVLEALEHVLRSPVRIAPGPLWTRSGAPEMRVEVHATGGIVHGFVARPHPTGGFDFGVLNEGGESPSGQEPPRAPRDAIPSAVRLRFSLERLVADSIAQTSAPEVAFDGAELASALAYVIGLRDGRIEAIEEGLRKVVPIARRIRAVKAPASYNPQVMADRYEIEIAGQGWLPPAALSEGTLLALALLTVLHAPSCPKIVLLDDVDRALHPRAQASVIEVIRGVQAGGVQVVCTSHSPYLLDCLEPQEVRIMKVTDQGLAQCRKLTDHPDWDRWKGSMRPGEFWGSVGEDWIS